MFTPNTVIRMISDAQLAQDMSYHDFARKSGITVTRWRELRNGKAKLSLEELPKLADAVGLSFQVVAPHHAPFLQLTYDEIESILALADHYKRNGPKQQHPLRSAVEKLTSK